MTSARKRVVLTAVCEVLIPSVFTDGGGEDLVDALESRIEGLPSEQRHDLLGLLSAFDSSIVRLLLSGRPRAFHAAPRRQQEAWLRRWRASRIPRLRTGYQALHRLVYFTHYASDAGATGVGARRPLAFRQTGTEGPLAGAADDSEPILRVAHPADWRVPALGQHTGPVEVASAAMPSGEHASSTRAHQAVVPPRSNGVHRTRVCVIGSGAGGSVLACRLAEWGHDVTILEEGGVWTPESFTERESEMVPRLYAGQGAQATDDLSFTLFQGRCAGGGTTVNWLIMLRPRADVMDDWERTFGAELMAESKLVPALELIEQETHTRSVPSDAHNLPNRLLLDGCSQLGWSAHAARINARNCVRAGACGLGCRYGARQGPISVYLPRALAAGARLIANTRADRIVAPAAGGNGIRVEAVQLDSVNARAPLTVECDHVVLAAGAIGTPVLLRRSGIGGSVVGRFLRLHPTTAVFGVHERVVMADGGIPQSALCTEFAGANGGYGFWIECPPWYAGTLAAAYPAIGDEHRAFMQQFAHSAPMIVLVRDGADGRSQGEVRLDRAGRIRVRYRTAPAERQRLAEGVAAAARIQLAAGAARVHTLINDLPVLQSEREIQRIDPRSFLTNRASLFSAHLNGTCRMGADPRMSGADPSGAVWGARNVWVADGSLLPTAPGVNPQATIMALGSLVAERVHGRLSRP